jgi:hypothetical protein
LRRGVETPRIPVHRTERLFIATLGLVGVLARARAISDNSTLTHLATGRTIAHGGGIPTRDPYSFTAFHHPWVVQSWLAEATYGWLERIGGLHLVVLEQVVLAGILAATIAWLARTGRALTTALAGLIAVFLGAGYWSPRPLLFGLLALALTVAVTEGQRSPWWLVPIAWIWVSAHGSFPLGLAWLVLSLVGDALDGKGVVSRRRLQCLGTFVVGLFVAMVNPLGPRLLLFPLKVQQKQAVFKAIIEWKSPNFQQGAGLLAMAGLAAAIVVLARGRPSWTHTLPAAVFVAFGLYASRNLAAAAIVLAPALGEALRPVDRDAIDRDAIDGGTADRSAREGPPTLIDRAFMAVIAVIVIASVAAVYSRPGVQLDGYPVAAVTWLDQQGLLAPGHRVVEPDVAGNYLEYRLGDRARVFVDDRYDMYPTKVADDYQAIFFVRPNALDVLDRYQADAVLWQEHQPLTVLLAASGRWRQAYRAGGWVVFVPNGTG